MVQGKVLVEAAQHHRCGIRRKADRIPTEGGQHSDDCAQPVIAA
jgi:hypothetical protein